MNILLRLPWIALFFYFAYRARVMTTPARVVSFIEIERHKIRDKEAYNKAISKAWLLGGVVLTLMVVLGMVLENMIPLPLTVLILIKSLPVLLMLLLTGLHCAYIYIRYKVK